jgi:hypothetical protein
MDLINRATQKSISIRVDNVVQHPDGHLLVESMFSGVANLGDPDFDLAARLHPIKATAFEWIIGGQCSVADQGTLVPVVPDVQFHVSKPEGGITIRHFSEFVSAHRQLAANGKSTTVRATTTLSGFEPDAEPVLREMHDGSLLLIFACMPPRVTEQDPAKASRFDLGAFGQDLERAAGVPLLWDDREIFIAQSPQRQTAKRLSDCIQGYWRRSRS